VRKRSSSHYPEDFFLVHLEVGVGVSASVGLSWRVTAMYIFTLRRRGRWKELQHSINMLGTAVTGFCNGLSRKRTVFGA
jgi:hypothetical protein